MKVYKYRGGNEEVFKRDLESMCKNYFWASTFESLNDPYENTVLSTRAKNQLEMLSKMFGKSSENVVTSLENFLSRNVSTGIYSLSKTYKSELLWAHYANSHKGFCIEYEREILLDHYKSYEFYPFDIVYSTTPPNIDVNDFGDNTSLMQKMSGTKSMHWKHEEEYRIVTDRTGIQPYNYKALTSIYFGLKMPENQKTRVMTALNGRGINYFQVERIDNSYELTAKPVEDICGNEIDYLCKLKHPKELMYMIKNHNHDRFNDKASIEIELDHKITKDELRLIASKIKDQLFWYSQNIFMNYNVKNIDTKGFSWATTHYREGEIEIWINKHETAKI